MYASLSSGLLSRTNEALRTELSQGAGQAFTILLVLLSQVRGVKGVFLANQKVNGKVVTLITYNKGRDWDYLRPPSTDMNGKPTNCKPVSARSLHTPSLGWAPDMTAGSRGQRR